MFSPSQILAFNVSGGSLSLDQRDVRVFNNFTAPTANNNTVADPNWPGYDGAELAIWKAASEWGSALHGGNGAGDPQQSVGSGGANFDFSWQGNATDVGSVDDNVHSQLSGSSGGILAFTEGPVSDGWRTRYYENWQWEDGPGNVTSGLDLQGLATYQCGIALGLSSTTVPGATMVSQLTGTGVHQRSIEADDIAGVQFVYGAASASKPTIASVSVSSGNVTILGSNFSTSNNEVWFTQAGAGGTGDPIKVTGVTSNGTTITVAIPGTAGKGDLLVRNDGTSHANLSNAWPFDPNASPPSCGAIAYCTAKLSTNQCLPTIGYGGVPSHLAATLFTITTLGMESGVSAINFFGTTGQAAVPFQGGLLCAASPIYRLGGKFTGGTGPCTGSISYTLQNVIDNVAGGSTVVIGGTVNIQTWGRDLGDPFGSSLSDALEITVCP
jgi:hypothetical protein